MSDSDDRL